MRQEGMMISFPQDRSNFTFVDCRSSEEEVVLTRMIEKIIRRSESVDREALCILAGQQVRRFLQTGLYAYQPSGNF
jgi:hypothetical protein